jgi:hypothetical protein
MADFVKVFGCPAAHERCRGLRRPASENLQGRKPRDRERAGVRCALWGFERRRRGVCEAVTRSSALFEVVAAHEEPAAVEPG